MFGNTITIDSNPYSLVELGQRTTRRNSSTNIDATLTVSRQKTSEGGPLGTDRIHARLTLSAVAEGGGARLPCFAQVTIGIPRDLTLADISTTASELSKQALKQLLEYIILGDKTVEPNGSGDVTSFAVVLTGAASTFDRLALGES